MRGTDPKVTIPELVLFNAVNSLLQIIRDDFNSKSDETETLLYKVFKQSQWQNYAFFEQAKSVFLTTEEDQRHLKVNLFFNAERASIPTIHITLPAENSGSNGIGIDEGYADAYFNDANGTYNKTFTRRFNASFNIGITSDNTNEVVLIYHFLRSILISQIDHLQLAGLHNVRFSGGDLTLKEGLVPANTYGRLINLSCEYEVDVPDLYTNNIITGINFQGEFVSARNRLFEDQSSSTS